jgi:hypothetical protein
MKREDILAILEDAETDNSAKMQKILDMHGTDLTAKNATIKTLEEAAKTHAEAIGAERAKYKDYDAILKERDTLKAEKDARAFEERFTTVLGNHKPKNDFTKDGLINRFREETAKPENEGKKDSEIFAKIIEGKEKDYFDSPVRFTMTPSNPSIKPPTDTESYLDEVYKNNPYYKKTN